MGIHENFVGGNWTEASTAAPNVNPSNSRDIVGEYARGTRDDANRAIGIAKTAFPAWSRTRSWPARTNSAGCSPARRARFWLRGSARVVRAGQIFAFFAGEALRIAG